jgi:hypothetical protein
MSTVNLSAIADILQQLAQFTTQHGITDPDHPINSAIAQLMKVQSALHLQHNRNATTDEIDLGVYESRWDRLFCKMSAQAALTQHVTYNPLSKEQAIRLDKFMTQMSVDMENDMKLICQNGVVPHLVNL